MRRSEDGRAFNVGDIVTIHGDDTSIYKVESYAKISEYGGFEYFQYSLEYCSNDLGEFMEYGVVVYEEDIILLARADDADVYMRMGKRIRETDPLITTDELLDDLWSLMKLKDSFEEGSAMRTMIGEMIDDVKYRLKEGDC